MLLKKLSKEFSNIKEKIKVLGISTNSKKIKNGYIFFAIKGQKFNGENHIQEAIKYGAKVIVCSKNCKYKNKNLLIIKTQNIRYLLSEVASKFYNLKPKNIIAVTGTNGKTSVADLFFQILQLNGKPVASIGTLGIKYNNKIIKTDLTSPDTITLHQNLEKIKKFGIDNVIIETSSHGLIQKRVEHLNFKAGIFTNFSQDHLDYHGSMKSYLSAKLHLFKKLLQKNKILISYKFLKQFKILKKISQTRRLKLIDVSSIKTKLEKKSPKKFEGYQLNNLSMAIAAAKVCQIKEKKIFYSLNKIQDVDGRLELVRKFKNNIKVYVDYAHTPDALLKSINILKKKHGEEISLVFGCGGDRDLKKRPLMAKIASLNCKKIYITDDNPRSEKPEKIRKEIQKYIKIQNCFNIGNRAKAIRVAISNANLNEVILIAGKGHETHQIYKNKIIKFSDKNIINKLSLRKKKISINQINFFENKKIIHDLKKRVKIKNFHGLSIDSRSIKNDNLFLTLQGKKNNGAKFIQKALKKGAKYIVSSKIFKKYKNKTIKVKNEVEFLNNFAIKKRKYTNAKIFAITGSAGKTSLKDLLGNLLQNFGETLTSPKSYNNHLGVPLSLSKLHSRHKYGVFEVGMSKTGEINRLTKLIKPHIGIITNVGEAHIENFKNLKGIADAKGEIINNISKGGTVILNSDDKYFHYFQKKAKSKSIKVLSFGMRNKSDVFPLEFNKQKNKTKLVIKIKDEILKLEVRNINIYNILSSLALLKQLKLDLNKCIKTFKKHKPSEGRGKIYNVKRYNKNFKLIDESYNANPLSVKNAIQNFNLIRKNNFKKYLLLGDMLELGEKSNTLHKELSKVINNSDLDKVFIKGNKTLITYKNIKKNKRGNIFQHEEDVDFILNTIIANNDHLMIKGSNATGLNNLSKKIIRGH